MGDALEVTLPELAETTERLGIGAWLAALVFGRQASEGMRLLGLTLTVVLVLAAPVLVAYQADDVDGRLVVGVLLLAFVNAVLALVWGSAARVPRRDYASFAMVCIAAAGIVLALLLAAST